LIFKDKYAPGIAGLSAVLLTYAEATMDTMFKKKRWVSGTINQNIG
jgi:hypothetical protein